MPEFGNVFILGSGFSRAVGSRMPTLAELSESVYQSLEDVWDWRWGSDLRNNVELLLTHLASDHPWEEESRRLHGRANYAEIVDVLVNEISRAERELMSEVDEAPTWLIDLVATWHRSQSVVITFNYDLLVERAHRSMQERNEATPYKSHRTLYPLPIAPSISRTGSAYGERRTETLSLLKLHGSVNWWNSGPGGPPGDPVFDSLNSARWAADTAHHEEHWTVQDKFRLVVPPAIEKGSYYSSSLVQAQWQMARSAIMDAETVTVIGYSLPAMDLHSRLLLSTSSADLRLRIVDLHAKADHYSDLLPGFHIEQATCGETAVPEFARSYSQEVLTP